MESESFLLVEVRKSVGKTIREKQHSLTKEKLIVKSTLSLTLSLILHSCFSINIIDLILIENINKTKMNIN